MAELDVGAKARLFGNDHRGSLFGIEYAEDEKNDHGQDQSKFVSDT